MCFAAELIAGYGGRWTLAPSAVRFAGPMSRPDRSRTSSFVVLFVLLTCVLSSGRTDPQSSTPTFQTSTELVSVSVVVKDRHGAGVDGLTRNDFHILEDGHEVVIRSFDTAATQTSPSTSVRAARNRPIVASQAFGPVPIILFFDQLNTPANDRPEVRRRLARWYQNQQTLSAPTCVILYTGSSVRIVQQPTFEAARVRAAIESIPTTVSSHGAGATGELPLPSGANENLAIGTGENPLRTIARMDYFLHREAGSGDTAAALIYTSRLFAAWPDEKDLIWISAGTTTTIETAPLQAAQVKLYAFNVHAQINYRFIASVTDPNTTYEYETEINNQLLQNLREAAEETGGELCNNSLEPQSCVQKALDDALGRYLLTYETHSRSKEPEWRQIQVRVDRQGLTLHARKGVMIDPALSSVKIKREQIAAALASPVDFPGLRLELQPWLPRQTGQPLNLSLRISSDTTHQGVWSTSGMDITVAGIVLRGSDVTQSFGEDIYGPLPPKTLHDLDTSGLTWRYKIAQVNGSTAVRIVVRDNATGRIGSIRQALP